jgi:hypothetical protein
VCPWVALPWAWLPSLHTETRMVFGPSRKPAGHRWFVGSPAFKRMKFGDWRYANMDRSYLWNNKSLKSLLRNKLLTCSLGLNM